MESAIDKYIAGHCTLECEALDWIEKQTFIRTNFPRMLSGKVQGAFLKMLVEMTGASRVLEIGTFTGYSAVCLALGLPADGHLDSLEINDEMEDLIREGWSRAGVSDKITLHIGDASQTLKTLDGEYDMVYIDANKREYAEYLSAVFPLLKVGGIVAVDDVLWDGKVCDPEASRDAQGSSLRRFNDLLASDPRFSSVIIPVRHGLTLARKISR